MSTDQTYKFIIPINSHSIVGFLNRIGCKLRANNHYVSYIPQNESIAETACEVIPTKHLHQSYLNHEPVKDLNTLCDKYGIDSSRELVFPQMVYDRGYDAPSYRHYWLSGTNALSYDRYINILHRTLDYLDIIYQSGEGGIPIQWQGAEVLRRGLQHVADHHGHQSVRASFCPIPGRVLLRSTEAMKLPDLQSATYENMSQEQRQKARNFRDTVIGDQKQVMNHDNNTESFYTSIRRNIRRIKKHKSDIIPITTDALRRRVVKKAVGTLAKQIYLNEQSSREFIKTKKYVFYPIQYFRESRVTMRAPAFYNQLWLIEYLSRSLPNGYELIVKDHPNQVGALPLSHIKTICRYTTAVAPTIPAQEVLSQADAIVTLNNTVGYEAIMHGKSVVSLGDAFYDASGYTRNIAVIDSLPTELNAAVRANGLNDQKVHEFAHGLLNASYRGQWGKIDDENIRQFTSSIIDYINK